MKHFNIRKIFKTAKNAAISKERLASGRERLMRSIEMRPIKDLSGLAEQNQMTSFYSNYFFKYMMPILLIVAIVLGGGGTVVASQNDLPGDALYKVKIISENVKEKLTFASAKKAEVKAQAASERVSELTGLVKRDSRPSSKNVIIASARYEKLLKDINELAAGLTPEQKLEIAPLITALVNKNLSELEGVRNSTATSTRGTIDDLVKIIFEMQQKMSNHEGDAIKEEPSIVGLATGTYAEAFILAKDAQKAAIDAKKSLLREKHDNNDAGVMNNEARRKNVDKSASGKENGKENGKDGWKENGSKRPTTSLKVRVEASDDDEDNDIE